MQDPFSWSFPIGRIFGIALRVHILFPVVMLGLILQASSRSSISGTWIDVACLMSIFFLTVTIHEIGHCFACRLMEGEANNILLWPLGGLAKADYLPQTPRAYFWFAAGGPMADLAICVLAAVGLATLADHSYQPWWNPFSESSYPFRWNVSGEIQLTTWGGEQVLTNSISAKFFAWIFYASWLGVLFNLVCIGFPFDGGQLLRAALWPYVGYRQATEYAIYTGFLVMIVLGVLSLVFNVVLLVFLALYVYVSCKMQWLALAGEEEGLFGYDFSQGYTSLEKDGPAPPKRKQPGVFQRWLQRRAERKRQQAIEQQEADERRMDELLQKIQREGKDALTDEENRFLKRVSDRYRNRP